MPLASFMIFWIIFSQRVGEYLGGTTVASWRFDKRGSSCCQAPLREENPNQVETFFLNI